MVSLNRLWTRIVAFLFPMKGWAERVSLFRRGNITWKLELYPNNDPVCPWPHEWTVMSAIPIGGGKATIHYHDAISDVSGVEARGEDAVRCCRCGIKLHVAEAHMQTNLDIPTCSWCVGFVRRA